jgi:transposase
LSERVTRLRLIWADGGYAGGLVDLVRASWRWTLAIVKRTDDMHGFVVLPRRWVVERTFAWLGRNRRLSERSPAWKAGASGGGLKVPFRAKRG